MITWEDAFEELRKNGLTPWLDDAIQNRPDKIQVRLAYSLPCILSEWELSVYLKEIWRWN